MKKMFLILTLSLTTIVSIKADKLHHAVAKLEAAGRHPHVSERDMRNFLNAIEDVERAVKKTSSSRLQSWIKHHAKAVLNKRITPLTKQEDEQLDARMEASQASSSTELRMLVLNDKLLQRALLMEYQERIEQYLKNPASTSAADIILTIIAARDASLETLVKFYITSEEVAGGFLEGLLEGLGIQ